MHVGRHPKGQAVLMQAAVQATHLVMLVEQPHAIGCEQNHIREVHPAYQAAQHDCWSSTRGVHILTARHHARLYIHRQAGTLDAGLTCSRLCGCKLGCFLQLQAAMLQAGMLSSTSSCHAAGRLEAGHCSRLPSAVACGLETTAASPSRLTRV